MRARRSGFALILALLAVGALFALGMHSAVVARATVVEGDALASAAARERGARLAAYLALAGMLPADAAGGAPTGDDGAPGSGDGGVGEPREDPDVELPEFIKNLIPELEDVEEQAREETSSAPRALAPGVVGPAGGRDGAAFAEIGLPTRPLRVEHAGETYRVSFVDALGLLDVNAADERSLRAYFNAKGFGASEAAALTDQILDWRDEDRVPRSAGAEQDVYDVLLITCRDAPLATLEELIFLPAVTPEVFERIAPDLSLGTGGEVHLGTAPFAVLMGVPDMTAQIAQRIIDARSAGAITAETLDRILPPGRDRIREHVRLEPSSLLRVRVQVDADGAGPRVFEGMAHLGRRIRVSPLEAR